MHWYEKAINKSQEDDDGGEYDGTMYTPIYTLKAKMAAMYLEGDTDLDKDPSWAGMSQMDYDPHGCPISI